jgi:hypothetical protein
MSLVLEMPAEPVEVLAPPIDTTTADQAAELLDQVDPVDDGDGELAEESDEGNTDPTDLEAAAAVEPEPKPKKKRGRKKKGEQVEEQAAEQVAAKADQPAAEVAAEPTAEALAEPVTPPPIAPAKTDRNILDDIAFAEVQCEQAESVVLSCKEELKDAKKIYDAAVLRLRRLAQAVKNDSDRPLFRQPVSTLPADAALPPAVAPNPDLWRNGKVSELAISGKLIEKLEEAGVSTIGQLEDLRAQISTGREKWPKGIGKAKITEIEDAIVAWLTKNRDSTVFGQGVVDPVSEAAPQPTWEDLTEEQQLDFINQRAVQLDPDEAVNPVDAALSTLEPQHTASRAFFESGYIAGQNGDAVSTCGWVPGIEQDDWIRGWLKAGKEVMDATYGGELAEIAKETAEEPADEPAAEVDSLDDL